MKACRSSLSSVRAILGAWRDAGAVGKELSEDIDRAVRKLQHAIKIRDSKAMAAAVDEIARLVVKALAR